MFKLVSVFLILPLLIRADLIAYDCADPEAEISRVSLLDIQPCRDPRNASHETEHQMQIVQQRRYEEVRVYECLVTVEQLIQHCGMHSHISAVIGGLGKYVHEIKSEACRDAHRYGEINLSGIGADIQKNLKPNSTTAVSVTLEGAIDVSGKCQGVPYKYLGNSYTDVIVLAAITIKLHDYIATADVEQDNLRLSTNTVCKYTDKYCFDDLSGEVTWEPVQRHLCSPESTDILFDGTAKMLTVDQSNVKYVIVEVDDTVFALRLVSEETLCNQRVWRTEQNRILVILNTSPKSSTHKPRKVNKNVDMIANVLSKLLYLEIAFKKDMKDLVYDSIVKRCQLREKILRHRIALALESPNIISNLVKEAAGHTGRVMGEVLHIVRCRAKIVEFRKSEFCYQELPIWYRNQSRFMTPVTHIIQEYGTQVDCDERLPVLFHLQGQWLEVSPAIHVANPEPMILDANDEQDTLPVMKIVPISSHGMYTREEMDAFQHTLLFPNERRAVTNLMTRRVVGAQADTQGYHIPNVFSSSEFAKMAVNAADQVWGFLSRMGNLFSVIMLLYTTFSILGYIASVVLNFFSLKRAVKAEPEKKFVLWASLWHTLTNRYLINQMQPQYHVPDVEETLMPTLVPRKETKHQPDPAARQEAVPTDINVLRQPMR